jgi:hypothetical protein
MKKIISSSFASIMIALFVVGAGCAPKGSDVSNIKTDNPPRGNDAASNITVDDLNQANGTKDRFYISTDPEVCKFKTTPDTCAAAGAKFFTDDKGCGCLTGN